MFWAILTLIGVPTLIVFLAAGIIGGRRNAVPPGRGAGIYAQVKYLLEAFGENIQVAAGIVLLLLSIAGAIYSGVQWTQGQGYAYAVPLTVSLIAGSSLLFYLVANEAEKKARAIFASTVLVLIAVAVVVIAFTTTPVFDSTYSRFTNWIGFSQAAPAIPVGSAFGGKMSVLWPLFFTAIAVITVVVWLTDAGRRSNVGFIIGSLAAAFLMIGAWVLYSNTQTPSVAASAPQAPSGPIARGGGTSSGHVSDEEMETAREEWCTRLSPERRKLAGCDE